MPSLGGLFSPIQDQIGGLLLGDMYSHYSSLISFSVWLAYLGDVAPGLSTMATTTLQMPIVINAPLIAITCYSLFYLLLDPIAGLSWATCVGLPLWYTATTFHSTQTDTAWKLAIPIHVFSWYMQIHPGHAVLEKRKPALLDSLVQAFALAPLFVWFELLFFLGYRPSLHQQLQRRVAKEISAFRKRQKSAIQ